MGGGAQEPTGPSGGRVVGEAFTAGSGICGDPSTRGGGGTPVYISAPQRTSCVTLGEFFSISVPVFLHLENEDANSTTSQGGVRMDEAEGSAPAECSTAHERGLFS